MKEARAVGETSLPEGLLKFYLEKYRFSSKKMWFDKNYKTKLKVLKSRYRSPLYSYAFLNLKL